MSAIPEGSRMRTWQTAETAPRDRMILADMGMPWACLAIWNEPSGNWCVTELEVDLYEGQWNDAYITHTLEGPQAHAQMDGFADGYRQSGDAGMSTPITKGQMKHCVRLPRDQWPYEPAGLAEVWRSKEFLVQIYDEGGGVERMSVCRTRRDGDRWADQIAWDELQRLKREVGRGDRDAFEIYPADIDVVNVANMRHLWLPVTPIGLAWRRA